jgi:tetratricopeptide (TPR) repeat protein
MGNHYWIRAELRRDRERIRSGLDLPPVLAVVDAHRRLRGPYTAAGTLLRLIAPDALQRCPELGVRHRIELAETTPELHLAVPPRERTLEATVSAREHSRYPARLQTWRLSHGVVEFIRDYLAAVGEPRTLVVENAQHADYTDHEFLGVLLRRVSPELLTVVVGTAPAGVTSPPGPVAIRLADELGRYTTALDGPPAAAGSPGTAADPAVAGARPAEPEIAGTAVAELAAAFVDSDGTSDEPRLLAGYRRLPADRRAALHDARAAELQAREEPSLMLGAVTYHLEHGTDRAAAVAALTTAQLHCKLLGFYHTAAELGLRGRALVDPHSDWDAWWQFTSTMTVSLSAAGRAEEAEGHYHEAHRRTIDPVLHMNISYATAMLYARHYDERRDSARAREYINIAIAFADLLPDPKERAYNAVFMRNGLALVEVRDGNNAEAVRLLDEGMARLDRDLDPGEHRMHRSGLRYNRAQVLAMGGRLAEALAEYRAIVVDDPNMPDHHFNMGNLLRGLGRTEEAIANYERALALSPPFPEVYYNRGDARMELGDLAGALADFGRVLELQPGNVDALLNRATVHRDLGELAEAWADVQAGLALEAGNARLLCLQAGLLAERGEPQAAYRAASAAVQADPRLAEAWAVRAGLAYQDGDLAAAMSDLDRAVELGDTPEIRYNRAVAYEGAGRYAEALADYDAVLANLDDEDARMRRETCRKAVATGPAIGAVAGPGTGATAGPGPGTTADPRSGTTAGSGTGSATGSRVGAVAGSGTAG